MAERLAGPMSVCNDCNASTSGRCWRHNSTVVMDTLRSEIQQISDAELVDPVVEQVEDECPKCGAYVLNHALHAEWHRHLRLAVEEAQAEAKRYKSPPRYGGR